MSEVLPNPPGHRGSEIARLMQSDVVPLPDEDMCRPGSLGREYWDCYRKITQAEHGSIGMQRLIRYYLAMSDMVGCANFRSLCLGIDGEISQNVVRPIDIDTHDPVSVGEIIRQFDCAYQLLEYLSSDSGTGVCLSDLVDNTTN